MSRSHPSIFYCGTTIGKVPLRQQGLLSLGCLSHVLNTKLNPATAPGLGILPHLVPTLPLPKPRYPWRRSRTRCPIASPTVPCLLCDPRAVVLPLPLCAMRTGYVLWPPLLRQATSTTPPSSAAAPFEGHWLCPPPIEVLLNADPQETPHNMPDVHAPGQVHPNLRSISCIRIFIFLPGV